MQLPSGNWNYRKVQLLQSCFANITPPPVNITPPPTHYLSTIFVLSCMKDEQVTMIPYMIIVVAMAMLMIKQVSYGDYCIIDNGGGLKDYV